MCCKSCEEQPASCCSTFYAFFCMGAGFFMFSFSLHNVIISEESITIMDWFLHIHGTDLTEKQLLILYASDLIFAFTYVLAGVLLAWGIKSGFIKAGKILSYFFPIYNIVYVFPLVIHIGCVIKLCRYLKENFD
uniref:Uncharacterized protein, isoform C n=1 Tax=Drosophila melanogaster TaxID=7227 RepID=Q8IQR8_DROME|nr:uncharacterized protein Dmel_CG32192, isoform C [Drosophila melanogaster]AAN11692.1 uncharacterized protein Dmel_CG32192, isoform C [Drosophila melanogaster]|eukprot:NP_730326.1 uncharacterized protein Dmel_CG32192, isoform C [Drosophila melanogaster]